MSSQTIVESYDHAKRLLGEVNSENKCHAGGVRFTLPGGRCAVLYPWRIDGVIKLILEVWP